MTHLHTTNRAWRSIRVNPKWIAARYIVGYLDAHGVLAERDYPRFATLGDVRNGVAVPKHEIHWEDGSVTYA